MTSFLNSVAESAFWFLVVVGLLVFLHEAGHFLTAKLFGMRVEVFSLGFGRRLFGRQVGATDYRISLIPLGGYVKLAGGEEGEEGTVPADGDGVVEALPPDYFRSRPRWQRFLVLVMGALVNLVLAVGLFATAFMVGIEMPTEIPAVVDSVESGSAAALAGFASRDRVVEVNGRPVTGVDDIHRELVRGGSRDLKFVVEREAGRAELVLTPRFDSSGVPELGLEFSQPAIAWEVLPDRPAMLAGVKARDEIVAIDGEPVRDSRTVAERIHRSAGKELALTLERDGQRIEVAVTPERSEVEGKVIGLIGINLSPVELVRLPPAAALRRGASTAWDQAGALFQVLGNLVTRNQPFRTLSGPIEIARASREWAGRGVHFLFWIAFISLQLGILNLLPIPMLDGGHIFILLTEGILRRDLSLELKELLNKAGLLFLVVLMALVVVQDLLKNLAG